MGEQNVMHLPKLTLGGCRLGRFGCTLGIRMYLRLWKVAKYKAQVVELLLDRLD
jgi:hypothetical protein